MTREEKNEAAMTLKGLTVCVFAGASPGKHMEYVAVAEKVGSLLGSAGVNLVYGAGASGVMGAIAKAALAADGHVTGVLPTCFQERDDILRDVSSLVIEDTMHHRKHIMYKHADIFLALPGGLGTLDEVMEVLTWLELGFHHKPIILFDIKGFWAPLLSLLRHIDEQKLVRTDSARLIKVVNDEHELWKLLKQSFNANRKIDQTSIRDRAERLSTSPFKKAFLLQHFAAQAGFTWPTIDSAVDKIKEELDELIQEIKEPSHTDSRMEEYGDLLFALINLSRYLNVDIDVAVETANQKFERRFSKVEAQIVKSKAASLTLEEMLKIWNKAKDNLYDA